MGKWISAENTRLAIAFAGGVLVGETFAILGGLVARRLKRSNEEADTCSCSPAPRSCPSPSPASAPSRSSSSSSSTSPATPRPTAAPAAASVVYLAQPGDGVFEIAVRFRAAGRPDWWGELQRANPQKTPATGRIGWTSLLVGEKVRIPAAWTGTKSA